MNCLLHQIMYQWLDEELHPNFSSSCLIRLSLSAVTFVDECFVVVVVVVVE